MSFVSAKLVDSRAEERNVVYHKKEAVEPGNLSELISTLRTVQKEANLELTKIVEQEKKSGNGAGEARREDDGEEEDEEDDEDDPPAVKKPKC